VLESTKAATQGSTNGEMTKMLENTKAATQGSTNGEMTKMRWATCPAPLA